MSSEVSNSTFPPKILELMEVIEEKKVNLGVLVKNAQDLEVKDDDPGPGTGMASAKDKAKRNPLPLMQAQLAVLELRQEIAPLSLQYHLAISLFYSRQKEVLYLELLSVEDDLRKEFGIIPPELLTMAQRQQSLEWLKASRAYYMAPPGGSGSGADLNEINTQVQALTTRIANYIKNRQSAVTRHEDDQLRVVEDREGLASRAEHARPEGFAEILEKAEELLR